MLVGVSGCFVFDAPPYPPENQAPEYITGSFPTDGSDVIVLESDVETLFAVASDGDGDEISYSWTVDTDPVPNAIDLNPGSMITLEVVDDLQDAELRCTIFDGLSDPVVLTATLEVP